MWVWTISLLVVAAVSGVARADDATEADADVTLFPPGDVWWCYSEFINQKDDFYKSSFCFRSKANCSERAAKQKKAIPAASNGSFICESTSRVAAFTAHDVVKDAVDREQFLKMQDCVDAQRHFATADYDQISRCTVIGSTVGSPFRGDGVPDGKGWFCATIGSVSTCRRTKADCLEHSQQARQREPEKSISACTSQRLAYATSNSTGLWLFSSEKACQKALDYLESVSPCTRIP